MLTNEILPVTLVAIDRVTAIRRSDGYKCEEIYHRYNEQYSKPNWKVSPLDPLFDIAPVHCRLTTIGRKFVSPISAVSREGLRVRRNQALF